MLIDERDRGVIRWATEKAYTFDYCRPNGLPDPCLQVRLGLSRAFFHRGKLVHWSADSSGDHLDQLMFEMASLFAMCAQNRAYTNSYAAITPADEVVLKMV